MQHPLLSQLFAVEEWQPLFVDLMVRLYESLKISVYLHNLKQNGLKKQQPNSASVIFRETQVRVVDGSRLTIRGVALTNHVGCVNNCDRLRQNPAYGIYAQLAQCAFSVPLSTSGQYL